MGRIIEIGTISSRGQIAIPSKIRGELELNEGEKILFVLDGDTLIIKKVSDEKSWEEITKPLRSIKKKIKEENITGLIHRIRKEKRTNESNS